jgi:hypothetical protein
MLADTANKLPDLTRQAVIDALKTTSGYDTGGLTLAPIDYTAKATAMGGTIPNLYPSIAGAWAYKFDNGQYVPAGDGTPLKLFG